MKQERRAQENIRVRRWICLLLAAVLCLSVLAGCSSGGGNGTPGSGESGAENRPDQETESQSVEMDIVYQLNELPVTPPMETIREMMSSGDKLFIFGVNRAEEPSGGDTEIIVSGGWYDTEMTTVYKTEPQSQEESGVITGGDLIDWTVDDAGDLIVLEESYTVSGAGYNSERRLIMLDGDGTEVWSRELNDIDNAADVFCDSDVIMVRGDSEILLFDMEGNEHERISFKSVPMLGFIVREDSSVYVIYSGEGSKNMVVTVDRENGELGEPVELPWDTEEFTIGTGGNGYDLCLWNSNGIAGYRIGDDTYTELVKFEGTDLYATTFRTICPVSEERFVVLTQKPSRELEVGELIKADSGDLKEKEIITIAYLYGDTDYYGIRAAAWYFNQQNSEYLVQLKDYSDYKTRDNPTGHVQQLNLDMTTGNAPDILLIEEGLIPVDNYIKQGLLEDLYTWIDNDPEMSREDFLTNVFEAYSVDGKLYELTPTFTVETVVGKTSIVGDISQCTGEELSQLLEQYPDSELFSDQPRSTYVYLALLYCFDVFVDETNGTCNFDSEEFVRLLEWANELPEPEEGGVTLGEKIKENKTLLSNEWVAYFSTLKYIRGFDFGEAVSYIGFPDASGNGAVFSNGVATYAMTSQSEHKEGAWEFLRFCLSDEYYVEKLHPVGFPVRISALEKLAEQEIKDFEDGKGSYNEFWTKEELTKEFNDWIDYISEIEYCGRRRLNRELWNMIEEELAPYFSGQKTAKAVAEIIQNRAAMWIAERN